MVRDTKTTKGHFWSVAKVVLRFGCAKQSKKSWLVCKLMPCCKPVYFHNVAKCFNDFDHESSRILKKKRLCEIVGL